MAQKFVSPRTESELRIIQDQLYAVSKAQIEQGQMPSFKGLLEFISAEPTILTAIHNIKANKGSKTSGCDNEKMQEDILEKDYHDVIIRVQTALAHYRPKEVRRVYIPKPGKVERRPLGIPTIIDRIIQECVRLILEPILEAQFYNHSYGFRPMCSAQQALARVTSLVHQTGYFWIIEGDISKYFDTINHTVLLRKLYHMGIKDRRVLMIIKAMLKAGIMGELTMNPLGTPQGGIISPLLANAYLHAFDVWCAQQWHKKKTRVAYFMDNNRLKALRQRSSLKPGYLVRYADDWVLITNSRRNAEKWEWLIARFLKEELRLTLSKEKTVITNIRKKVIRFLGFEYKVSKVAKGIAAKGYITRTKPDEVRIKAKVKEIHQYTKSLRKAQDINTLLYKIAILNSKICGVINYYQAATWVSPAFKKYSDTLKYAGYKALKGFGGKWIPAKQVDNLIHVHSHYTSQIPAIQYQNMTIGITSLQFCRFEKVYLKSPNETPYSIEGRTIHYNRTAKRPLLARVGELYSVELFKLAAFHNTNTIYNFEYLLNRGYAYNRDKAKCRVCGVFVDPKDLHCHHIDKALPLSRINKVVNLATTHTACHSLIHNDSDLSQFDKKIQIRICGFREIVR
jgi:RNA-directed DNA polymerase